MKYGHATDVIGTDDVAPAPFTVRNLVGSQRLRLTWGAAEWLNLTGKANLQLRHTSSERPDFSNIDAFDANYGVVATVKFTKNFSLSTDMTLFTRNGYDTPVMNNSDWVWNARLAYTFDRGRWTSCSTASTCSVSSTRCNMQSTHRDAPSDMSTRFRNSSFSTHSIR